ncbi:MAG: hypothetical protein ACTHK7_12370 [Aureliella sp.]
MNDTLARDSLHICEKMAAVRSRGLVNARELSEEVERLSDWREHVRAHPIPIALAAAVAGYWLVPSRRKDKTRHWTETRVEQPLGGPPTKVREVHEEKAKTAGIAGVGGAVMGFAGSLLGNAVRSYVMQQIQTMFQSKDDHASFVQRQSPTYRH